MTNAWNIETAVLSLEKVKDLISSQFLQYYQSISTNRLHLLCFPPLNLQVLLFRALHCVHQNGRFSIEFLHANVHLNSV